MLIEHSVQNSIGVVWREENVFLSCFGGRERDWIKVLIKIVESGNVPVCGGRASVGTSGGLEHINGCVRKVLGCGGSASIS